MNTKTFTAHTTCSTLTEAQWTDELARIKTNGVTSWDEYKRMCRTGASFGLSRKCRRDIWDTVGSRFETYTQESLRAAVELFNNARTIGWDGNDLLFRAHDFDVKGIERDLARKVNRLGGGLLSITR